MVKVQYRHGIEANGERSQQRGERHCSRLHIIWADQRQHAKWDQDIHFAKSSPYVSQSQGWRNIEKGQQESGHAKSDGPGAENG